jgi:hypothetical protein
MEGVEGKMAKISNADLDQLTSEVLPERSVLGIAGMGLSIGGSAAGTTEGLPVVGGVVSGGMEAAGSLPG